MSRHDHRRYGAPYDDGDRGPGGRGVPDSLLVGGLAALLCATLLIWSSTGLAGRLAHGSWPTAITFDNTPAALRHLITNPQDVTGAWPATPAEQLSGHELFWTLFAVQTALLVVAGFLVMGLVARLRTGLTRAERAHARKVARHHGSHGSHNRYSAHEDEYGELRQHGGGGVPGGRNGERYAGGAGERHGLEKPLRGAPPTPLPHPPRAAGTPLSELPEPQQAQAQALVAAEADASDRAHSTPSTSGAVPPTGPNGSGPGSGAPVHASVPSARGPLFLGPPQDRHPVAAQAVRDAEGPALVITSAPALWEDTKDARAKLGPVLLYDPLHLCDTPARLHWSPSSGCEDRETAAQRARALLAPTRPTAKLDAAVADTAETLMRCFLHAAAVDGRQFRHVHRWAQGHQVQEAVRALRTNPKAASGSAGELEAALTAHPERRDMAQELTARTLSSLFTVNVREACTPNRTDGLALDSFVSEGGTIYLVGEAIEDPKLRPGAMPLLTALASSVVEHGRRMAERSSSGRLDPPLALVLDDVAAVAPLPQLPSLLAAGKERGLPTLALLRSREQARARWPEDELPA
ncbi:type VI secretion protein [Streptomyces sp. NPDC005955]|uniref:type VI secretion protein n=1 Tax=Streptomyces sp. NPDC005955 TaxID=3364738 RepID=UPI0036BDCF8F